MKQLFSFFLPVILLASSVSAQAEIDASATIRFKTFTASKQMEDVKLNWSVACNIQFALFEILRSHDGTNYITIHTFKADQLRCARPFNFIDKTAAGQVFYKIKTGDIDGRYSVEKTVSIFGKEITANSIKVIAPVLKNNLRCIISAKETGKATLLISATEGVLRKQMSVTFMKGVGQLEISVADLPGGVYVLSYVIKDEKKSVRFIKS
jgi:hypothetical protein